MANEQEAQPGIGDIPITMDGEELVLRPTLNAALFLSRQSGGLMSLVDKCNRLDFETITMIVASGLGYQGMGPKEIPGKIYRAGLNVMSAKAIQYVAVLTNAGKPIMEKEDEDKDPLQSGLAMKSST